MLRFEISWRANHRVYAYPYLIKLHFIFDNKVFTIHIQAEYIDLYHRRFLGLTISLI